MVNSTTKYLPSEVPDASVPVALNGVPNVTVYDDEPLVRKMIVTFCPGARLIGVMVVASVGVYVKMSAVEQSSVVAFDAETGIASTAVLTMRVPTMIPSRAWNQLRLALVGGSVKAMIITPIALVVIAKQVHFRSLFRGVKIPKSIGTG